jgi:hypothetical protein
MVSDEVGNRRRAAVVGKRLLGDWDNVGDGGSATAGERSLANLPAEAVPNALFAAGWGRWCSGVAGSDETPLLLCDGTGMLLSGVCKPSSSSKQYDSCYYLKQCSKQGNAVGIFQQTSSTSNRA